ncbi:MAG: primosomal protein N', partial [Clostridia bacterium]
PQMVGKLRAWFKGQVAIIHSGLSKGERFDEWWRIRKGEAKIVVGARSAIFAPLQNIGVIVIDEEHESSYISENSPRYNTFEVAKHRADKANAKIVLGSATPSVESYYKAKKGEYELIEISDRVNKMIMPRFDIVDMKREVTGGNKSVISGYLADKLKECLDEGNQAILFLNRRGFASYYQCEECGYVCKCNDCDVALTYHREEHALKCHYCGQKYIIPTECPDCHSKHFKRGGVGTETVVKELSELFPNARVLRMDNDTTTTKESHNNILQAFRERKADVLVGTQMVAKGHDFPSVTLVGIINADMSLFFSDYRSGERTFQLITQVAGRAGRGDRAGTVVLQTSTPRHYIYNFATHYNYKEFYEFEINSRQVTNFPPFADIVRIMMYSENEPTVRDVARTLFNKIKDFKSKNEDSFSYFNGMKSPINRIENKFRYQILARLVGDNREEIIEKLYQIVDENKVNGAVTFLEVNPNSMF